MAVALGMRILLGMIEDATINGQASLECALLSQPCIPDRTLVTLQSQML